MIRSRSTRDRERIDYEGHRAVTMLTLEAIGLKVRGEERKAEARYRMARDLERALNGQQTGFDTLGGRGEWLKQREQSA
jgi:hypothetical protein